MPKAMRKTVGHWVQMIEEEQTIERIRALKRSNFISELTKLVTYGCLTRVFSVVIKKDKCFSIRQLSPERAHTRAEEKLIPIEIDTGFLKEREVKDLLFQANNRTSWETRVFENYNSEDQDSLRRTMLNFDLTEKGFDDMLYRIFTRKVQHISLREGQTLYFAKLAHFRELELKTPEGPYPFDIGIYLMMKEKSEGKKKSDEKVSPITTLSPIMTLSAVLTPCVKLKPNQLAREPVQAFLEATVPELGEFVMRTGGKYSPAFEDIEKFLFMKEASQKDVEISIDNIMLFAFAKYFLKPLNNDSPQMPQMNPVYVRRSGALTRYLLVVRFSEGQNSGIDPLASCVSSESASLAGNSARAR